MSVLGIEESVFFDPSIIKVLDGIAGSAKSTEIDNAFNSADIEYVRYVQNNAQKRDCENRFSSKCMTAASGLTTTEGFRFYVDFKYPDCKNTVIDEFVMQDKKIIDWVFANRGEYNIILTGDSYQLSAPDCEYAMKEAVNRLKNDPNVVYVNLTYSKRPRTDKTREYFNEFYEMAKEDSFISIDDLPFLRTPYKDISYNEHDAFVCRDNESEMLFYNDNCLSTRYDLSDYGLLTPKGYIASKNTVSTAYPILPQRQANDLGVRAYLQVQNVGSILRFQGQEVTKGNKLYFLVKDHAKVSTREIYTAITRMWDIDDFRIVIVPKRNLKLATYKGLPIYSEKTAIIDYLASLDEDEKAKAISSKDFLGYYMPKKVTATKMKAMIDEYSATHKNRLKKNEIYHSRYIKDKSGDIVYYVDEDDIDWGDDIKKARKVTPLSLIRHEGQLQYSYMNEVYAELEKHGFDELRPCMICHRHKMDFEMDLYSAFPHILKFCDLPIDGTVTFAEDTTGERINYYVYTGDSLPYGCILDDTAIERVKKYNLGTYEYLFSVPKGKSTYVGNWLYTQCHKDIESKDALKGFHYGRWGTAYLTLDGSCDKEYYVKNDHAIYRLLWCHMYSVLTAYMLDVMNLIEGEKHMNVDAVHFNNIDSLQIDELIKALPEGFHFRIKQHHEGSDDSIVFQTYEPLKHKRASNLAKQKENMTDEQKQALRDYKREQKRKERARKRALANKA